MGKRKFLVEFEISAIIELDDQVIDVVDDEWRKDLYDLRTPEAIAAHIGFASLNGMTILLDCLDGWADQPNSNARVIEYEVTERGASEIK